MDQAKLELQLKVWKDLAVKKQMLMSAATEALGLPPECSMDELKVALEASIQRAQAADGKVKDAQEQSKAAVEAIEKTLAETQKKLAATENAKSAAEEALKTLEQQVAVERETNVKEQKKLKAQIVEKEKALKAINVALADTPENVVKKLKAAKKEKNEESAARRTVETELRTVQKQKQELDKRIAEMQATLDKSAKLAERYRELHELASEQKLESLPELETELLEGIEQTDGASDKKDLASAA